MATEPFMAADIYPMLASVFLAVTVVLPLVVLETVALFVAGAVLAVPRALGLVRHRVDVLEHIGRHLYSDTILLVRGRRRARQLVEAVRDERRGATEPFRPDGLPGDVEVRRSVCVPGRSDSLLTSGPSPSGPA